MSPRFRDWRAGVGDLRLRVLVCILCLNMISLAIHAGGPDSLNGLRDATRAKPDSWASRRSSPVMIDLLTAGENRHSRIIVEKNVTRNMENMALMFNRGLDSGAEHQQGLRERRTS